jgi:hypothetical protein
MAQHVVRLTAVVDLMLKEVCQTHSVKRTTCWAMLD